MKRLFILLTLIASPLLAQAQINVSTGIGEPGFYGRINITNMPPPNIVYPAPIVIQPTEGIVEAPPIYLYVPPEHHKNWSKYCHQYQACGRKVYFVSDDWYAKIYVPQYKQEQAQNNHDEYDHDEDH